MAKTGGARPGAGRKPLPPEERRSERVALLLTPAEMALLETLAGEDPPGRYASRVVARHLARLAKNRGPRS